MKKKSVCCLLFYDWYVQKIKKNKGRCILENGKSEVEK